MLLYCCRCGEAEQGVNFNKLKCGKCGSNNFQSTPPIFENVESPEPIVPWDLSDNDKIRLIYYRITPE